MTEQTENSIFPSALLGKIVAVVFPYKHLLRDKSEFKQEFEISVEKPVDITLSQAVQESSAGFSVWLAKKYLEETCHQYRTIWELYIRFYTVFLTVNFTAVAITIQYFSNPSARAVMCISFILQNCLAAGTAINISLLSPALQVQCEEYATVGAALSGESLPARLRIPPIAGKLGQWGGIANFVGHFVFICVWSALLILWDR